MNARVLFAAGLVVSCGDPSGAPPLTRLELHAVPMMVDACDGSLVSWSVHVRETGEHYTRPCDQAIILSELQPYRAYTLECVARTRNGRCQSAACIVTPSPGIGIASCADAETEPCAP